MKKLALFLSTLTVIFFVLKLMGVLTWSWLWVFAPLWIPVASFCVVLTIAIIISVIQEDKS